MSEPTPLDSSALPYAGYVPPTRDAFPSYDQLAKTFTKLHGKISKEKDTGKVADYIPELAATPESWDKPLKDKFGAAFCLVKPDKEGGPLEFSVGDTDPWSIQSVSKVVPMLMGVARHSNYDKYVGHEPSGKPFNDLSLREHPESVQQPYNSMINAGAIMACSLFEADKDPEKRELEMLKIFGKMSARKEGDPVPEINWKVKKSEAQTGDNNKSMMYAMLNKDLFPGDKSRPHAEKEKSALEALDLYFKTCSIEMSVKDLSVLAATLANGGINPHTGKCPFTKEEKGVTRELNREEREEAVRRCLSVMRSCGTYDASGHTMYTLELPVKSGVGGMVMCVVPGQMGFAVWAPPLDKNGNSVKGMKFCEALVKEHPQVRDFERLVHQVDSKIQYGPNAKVELNQEESALADEDGGPGIATPKITAEHLQPSLQGAIQSLPPEAKEKPEKAPAILRTGRPVFTGKYPVNANPAAPTAWAR